MILVRQQVWDQSVWSLLGASVRRRVSPKHPELLHQTFHLEKFLPNRLDGPSRGTLPYHLRPREAVDDLRGCRPMVPVLQMVAAGWPEKRCCQQTTDSPIH